MCACRKATERQERNRGIRCVPPPEGKRVDCATGLRHGDRWYRVYVQLKNEPQGYTTQLATSDDLLHWQVQGRINNDLSAPGYRLK